MDGSPWTSLYDQWAPLVIIVFLFIFLLKIIDDVSVTQLIVFPSEKEFSNSEILISSFYVIF